MRAPVARVAWFYANCPPGDSRAGIAAFTPKVHSVSLNLSRPRQPVDPATRQLNALPARLSRIVRLRPAGRDRHQRRAGAATRARLRTPASAARAIGADDRHSRAAVLSARRLDGPRQRRKRPPGDGAAATRRPPHRRPDPRLGLPRLSRTGHRLRRAPRPRACRRSASSTTRRTPASAFSPACCRWPT